MGTPAPMAPDQNEDTEKRVASHRQAIIEEACALFGTDPQRFYYGSKSTQPFIEIAFLAAFLLERDTAASSATIAHLLGCGERGVADFIKKISSALNAGDKSIIDRVLMIRDKILIASKMAVTSSGTAHLRHSE